MRRSCELHDFSAISTPNKLFNRIPKPFDEYLKNCYQNFHVYLLSKNRTSLSQEVYMYFLTPVRVDENKVYYCSFWVIPITERNQLSMFQFAIFPIRPYKEDPIDVSFVLEGIKDKELSKTLIISPLCHNI